MNTKNLLSPSIKKPKPTYTVDRVAVKMDTTNTTVYLLAKKLWPNKKFSKPTIFTDKEYLTLMGLKKKENRAYLRRPAKDYTINKNPWPVLIAKDRLTEVVVVGTLCDVRHHIFISDTKLSLIAKAFIAYFLKSPPKKQIITQIELFVGEIGLDVFMSTLKQLYDYNYIIEVNKTFYLAGRPQ